VSFSSTNAPKLDINAVRDKCLKEVAPANPNPSPFVLDLFKEGCFHSDVEKVKNTPFVFRLCFQLDKNLSLLGLQILSRSFEPFQDKTDW